MEVLMSEMWREAMAEAFRDTSMRLALLLPKLLALVTFLVLGVAAGWLVKFLLLRLLSAVRFDAFCERMGLWPALTRAGVPHRTSQVMGIDALGLPATANLMSLFLWFLPNVVAAAFLLLFGAMLANFMAEAALISAVNAQLREARIIANLVRWGIWLLTAAMVLTQLGIAKDIVVAAFSITFGGIVLALAISLGLGGRHIAREGLERRLRKKKTEEDELTHI
jgi:hypothetical protein